MASRKLPLHLAAGTLALGLAIAAPAVIWAQPQAGRLFRFSSCFTCSQHYPTVAGNTAGDFLGAWLEPRDVISEGVFSRTFGSGQTPFGNEFEVAPGEPGQPPQFDGAAAADSQGNFVVVWASMADDQSTILAQRFDPKGNALGGQVEVASDPAPSPNTPSDFKPAVAAAPGGGFVVAWVSLVSGDQTPGNPRVMARIFNGADAPSGPAVQLSTSAALSDRPSLCVSGTGRVHAAWTFTNLILPFQASPIGVVVRRLSPAGVPLGPEQVVAPPLDSESSVAVACGAGNTYMVAWQTAQPPAVSGSDIVAQRFTRLGRAVGGHIVLNEVADGEQRNPALIADSTGAFVAVWEGNPGGVNGVRGRRFGGNGAPLSDEFSVYNAGQGDFSVLRPALASVGTKSGFVVAVDGPGGVVGRVFSVTGTGVAATDLADAGPEAAAVDGSGTTGNGRGSGGLW
ncbi:MAG TPA: hypothetical protein VMW75_01005 [Thermoanaerobaculia bacterium]|nr:hypothetical protein [Thermoanaerobaculia bacterium]